MNEKSEVFFGDITSWYINNLKKITSGDIKNTGLLVRLSHPSHGSKIIGTPFYEKLSAISAGFEKIDSGYAGSFTIISFSILRGGILNANSDKNYFTGNIMDKTNASKFISQKYQGVFQKSTAADFVKTNLGDCIVPITKENDIVLAKEDTRIVQIWPEFLQLVR